MFSSCKLGSWLLYNMKNTIANFLGLLILWLGKVESKLQTKDYKIDKKSKFVDLAPTNFADKEGVYSDAIQFAINSSKVLNIALTGPYGSGKSSIIQSFLKVYKRPVLHISLASFAPEVDAYDEIEDEKGSSQRNAEKVNRQLIERSILQQMLYGADASKLPLSRFKRIQRPGKKSYLVSLSLLLGFVSIGYLIVSRKSIISGAFYLPLSFSNWFNLGALTFAMLFVWIALHRLYIASFGLSLKSISLKNIEIKPATDERASILNRHLDEIVYFFQSTKYDLVIIEDLDRFDNPEIFVTLREINSIINKNSGINRKVRFLYALRDDMFINTDRTKFFEFIIPVIPIINTSNSIDMVLKQGTRLDLDMRLERQFLREVSRYLNDLRLIQNIFNEYAIYAANLECEGDNILDPKKLLAILIYKNVYPRDFELLHRSKGALAEILSLQEKLIHNNEAALKKEISEIEKEIELAERQIPIDLRELQKIYAMTLIVQLPEGTGRVSLDNRSWVLLSQLVGNEKFESLIEASSLYIRHANNNITRLNIQNAQSTLDGQKSYLQRKVEIEKKAATNEIKNLQGISELRAKLVSVRTAKLKELLRSNPETSKDIFLNFGENGELARYLILEGHLDDTYYQYTSLFHTGRLSPNDNKFLIHIRAFVTPDPDFPIDNPTEVIEAMRNEDFRQSYVLNVKIVDTLLSDASKYNDQTDKLFEFLASEFETSEKFLEVYYRGSANVQELLSSLVRTWEGFIPTIVLSPNNISHITQLLLRLPTVSLAKLAKDFEELPTFVSENLSEILINSPEIQAERLASLGFEIKDLSEISEYHEIVRFMFEKQLFEITVVNLEHIFKVILGEINLDSFRQKNFTAIRATNSESLISRLYQDFECYLQNILLTLPENTGEDADAILEVMNIDGLKKNDIQDFLKRQTTIIRTLEGVPTTFHSTLFSLHMIEPTWENCHEFMNSEEFEPEVLQAYLEQDKVRDLILKHPIPDDRDYHELRRLILNSNSLSNLAYRLYIHALPNQFESFPEELDSDKLKILVKERKITFSKSSLDALSEFRELQVLFVSMNISAYLAEPDSFGLDDVFREELLRTELDDLCKVSLIELMDLSSLENHPKRAALIAPILDKNDTKDFKIDAKIAQDLIRFSTESMTKVSLLNKHHHLFKDTEIRTILAEFPKPFSEIKTGYHTPRLENTVDNLQLVKWLDFRNIISSWSVSKILNNEIRVNLRRS